MRARLFIALCALAAMVWAVPSVGAAHFLGHESATTVGAAARRPARFRVERDRGLLVSAWLNGRGPYVFAVDTGAGLNIVAQRVATQVGLPVKAVSPTILGGLSSARTTANREATINQLAIGDSGNVLTTRQTALVTTNLPADIDGVLDPTEAFAPYGYSIDMPNATISALTSSLDVGERALGESAVVNWVRRGGDNRPFIRLGDGRIALIDTGSGFGLGVSGSDAIIVNRNGEPVQNETVRDIAGGSISFRRVAPTTVSIGDMVLRKIPTDILFGVDKGTPLILGRDALYPFRISFDPQKRLIEIVATRTG